MFRSILLLINIAILVACFKDVSADRVECQKKYYSDVGSNSFVCVCNSTYCDTVEPVDNQNTDSFYQEFITCIKGYRLDKFKVKFESQPSNDSVLNIKINRSNTFQSIFGFGGAITDAAGFNIFTLSAKTIQNVVNSYFDESGIEYGVLRVPIGGVDFSLRPYSYDDTPNDLDLKNFAFGPEDIKWKIPFCQAANAKSKKGIKYFASAWSAPAWMKTNNNFSGNGTLKDPVGGIYYQTWANYYLKFFQQYKNNQIDFWGVTAQNEPTDGYLYKFSFNAMGFTPESQSAFVTKNLGPTLEQNGFGDIKIMILDDQRLFLPEWPQRVFDYSPDAKKYISGIAVHWYLDSVIPPKLLDLTHQAFPDKFIFGTEACSGEGPFQPHVILGGFNRAEDYAKYIIEDLNHWVTGWTDWNLALSLQGGPNWANNYVDAPIIVNSTADEFYKQPMFYAMGHFSKFITENSVRIESKTETSLKHSQISHVVFKNEESRQTILVLLNDSDNDFNYSIYDPDLNKYINSVSGAHSIKTIVWFY